MAKPFPQDVDWNTQPSGGFLSFIIGKVQARIYQQTGHIEIVGPDLAANPMANTVQFAPPAVRTAKGTFSIGGILSSKNLTIGLELKQQLGKATITSRLTFPNENVVRYEVIDWGGITPVATATTSSTVGIWHLDFFGYLA